MTKRGHRKTGVGLALCGASIALAVGYSKTDVLAIALIAVVFSSFPDNLEIKWWMRGQRHSLIPHRTITHWLTPWVCLAAWMIWDANHQHVVNHYLNVFVFGVASGCVGHILMDLMTPMGVPVLSPFYRSSLRLIHSGNPTVESSVAGITAMAGLFCMFFVAQLL